MWFNPIMEWILKSPIHNLISSNTMIIYYTGRKTGKAYHTPVGYQCIGEALLTTSWKDRNWWRNFREGGEAKILLKGKFAGAHIQAFEDEATVIESLKQFIGGNQRAARMFKIDVREDGQLEPEALRKAAQERVIIRTSLK
jgi:hypothetical protein